MKILVDESALRQSLEALEKQQETLKVWPDYTLAPHECAAMDASEKAITALRTALAQPATEPVAVVGTQLDVWRGYNGQWVPPGAPIKMAHMLQDLPIGTMLYAAQPYRPRCD